MLRNAIVLVLLTGAAFGQTDVIMGDARLESFQGGIRLQVDTNGDGSPDEVFFLSTDRASSFLTARYQDAEIRLEESRIIVRQGDQWAYFGPDYEGNADFGPSLFGEGAAPPSLFSEPASIFDESTDFTISPRAGGCDDCSSGGEGASECSISLGGSSCSVTCSSGFWACCKQGSKPCKCVRASTC